MFLHILIFDMTDGRAASEALKVYSVYYMSFIIYI